MIVVVVRQVGADLDQEGAKESRQSGPDPKYALAKGQAGSQKNRSCGSRQGPGPGRQDPGLMAGHLLRPGLPPGGYIFPYQGSHGYFRKLGFLFSM